MAHDSEARLGRCQGCQPPPKKRGWFQSAGMPDNMEVFEGMEGISMDFR